MAKTEPFHSGQSSNEKGYKAQNVPVKANLSKSRNIGQPDPLRQALMGRSSYIPSDEHKFSHSKTSKSGGAHYSPAGEFGRPRGTLGSKATNSMAGSGGKGRFGGKP